MKKEKIMSDTKYKIKMNSESKGVQVQLQAGHVNLYKGDNDVWLEIEDFYAECKRNLRLKKFKNIIEDEK